MCSMERSEEMKNEKWKNAASDLPYNIMCIPVIHSPGLDLPLQTEILFSLSSIRSSHILWLPSHLSPTVLLKWGVFVVASETNDVLVPVAWKVKIEMKEEEWEEKK